MIYFILKFFVPALFGVAFCFAVSFSIITETYVETIKSLYYGILPIIMTLIIDKFIAFEFKDMRFKIHLLISKMSKSEMILSYKSDINMKEVYVQYEKKEFLEAINIGYVLAFAGMILTLFLEFRQQIDVIEDATTYIYEQLTSNVFIVAYIFLFYLIVFCIFSYKYQKTYYNKLINILENRIETLDLDI
ncbi:MAG: hypothetical protein J1F31_05965 [Erysipelotrichales bacterium]|nr:hypothetical protein [Erysipelotrichales bacterium]